MNETMIALSTALAGGSLFVVTFVVLQVKRWTKSL